MQRVDTAIRDGRSLEHSHLLGPWMTTHLFTRHTMSNRNRRHFSFLLPAVSSYCPVTSNNTLPAIDETKHQLTSHFNG